MGQLQTSMDIVGQNSSILLLTTMWRHVYGSILNGRRENMKTAPFKSDFALLDVKSGRAALEKRISKLEKAGKGIRIRVDMMINYVHGGDDGVSQEFSCTVLSVKEFAS